VVHGEHPARAHCRNGQAQDAGLPDRCLRPVVACLARSANLASMTNRPGCHRARQMRANYPAEVRYQILVGRRGVEALLSGSLAALTAGSRSWSGARLGGGELEWTM
jgi:hypothetical protein